MMSLGGAEDSVDSLCDVCDRLHGALAERGMLGRHCKKRAGLLRALFRLIDLNSAQLNLHLVKLCLAVSRVCVCVCVRACKCKHKDCKLHQSLSMFQKMSEDLFTLFSI